MSAFDYTQRFTRRVITDPSMDRFIWNYHNFGTKYIEPFVHASVGLEGTQTYVPYKTIKPVRLFSLEFPMLMLQETDYAKYTGLAYRPELDFRELQKFYLKHKSHKPFIYEHPIYGDLVVRFAKALTLPLKKQGGKGVIEGFTLELQEVVTTDFTFQKGENLDGDLPFPLEYFDVEIEYPDSSNLIPLGNNYTLSFKKIGRDIRTFKLTCSGLKYVFDSKDKIVISHCPEQNMALLELFYLKHRLSKKFDFEYLGEIIPVRFKEPIGISKVEGNTGIISKIELVLVETPYKTHEDETVYEPKT